MYNKHEIMINAWSIRRSANVSMSIAIKAAEAVAENITWNTKIHINDWAKSGHNRTYVEVAVYTNAWNRKRTERIGYVDNMTGSFVAA